MIESFPGIYAALAESVRKITAKRPETGIILGSGLSDVGEALGGESISYSAIEGMPLPGVSGHKGILHISDTVATLSGRFHYYEGHSMSTVVLPVFLLYALGVKRLIVTNAAGAVNPAFVPGDLVLIRDHINLMGSNPLIGPNPENFGPRFPDMTACYSEELMNKADAAADRKLSRGVYAALSGPVYETPAEIKMLGVLGADLVGMSTVPEVIAARYLGMQIAGISCVTNMAAGITGAPLDHAEVLAAGKKVKEEFSRMLLNLVDSF